MQLPVRIRAKSRLAPACLALVIAMSGGAAHAQSLTGTWQVTVTEVSNTCFAPLGPPEATQIEILQAGDLIAAEGASNQTGLSGVVSGSDVAIGFEVFEDDGLVVYDPAENQLAIDAGGTLLSGDLHWDFYEPLDCTGTHDWSAVRDDAGTPGDLSGNWVLTATELTETCRAPDPNPFLLPLTIQQEGEIVRVVSEVSIGQIRLAGRISGSTLQLGAGFGQNGGFTVFDAAENALVIDPSSETFTGTVPWRSFTAATCSGVDSFVATLPEPDATLGMLAVVASLAAIKRRRVAS